MPGGLDTHGQAALGGVPHGGHHVLRRAGGRDHVGPLDEAELEGGQFVVVADVAGAEEGQVGALVRVRHGTQHGRIT